MRELRAIKDEFKRKNKGERKSTWVPKAICVFNQKIKAKYSHFPEVFVKVNDKTKERALHGGEKKLLITASGRQLEVVPAKVDEALTFFLEARDAPKLDHELARHLREMAVIKEQILSLINGNPDVVDKGEIEKLLSEISIFEQILVGFKDLIKQQHQGIKTAEIALEGLTPIKTLNKACNNIRNIYATFKAESLKKRVSPNECAQSNKKPRANGPYQSYKDYASKNGVVLSPAFISTFGDDHSNHLS